MQNVRTVAQRAKILAGRHATEAARTEKASVKATIAARDPMSMFDGGVDVTVCEGTLGGVRPVVFRTAKRRKEQVMADENKEVKNPATMMNAIFARSAAGSCGASGSMTRFGTKKTASQRLRNATPGVK